jgi:hypothetical protein
VEALYMPPVVVGQKEPMELLQLQEHQVQMVMNHLVVKAVVVVVEQLQPIQMVPMGVMVEVMVVVVAVVELVQILELVVTEVLVDMAQFMFIPGKT